MRGLIWMAAVAVVATVLVAGDVQAANWKGNTQVFSDVKDLVETGSAELTKVVRAVGILVFVIAAIGFMIPGFAPQAKKGMLVGGGVGLLIAAVGPTAVNFFLPS